MVDEIFSLLVFIDEWINNVRMSNLFGNIEVYFGKIYKIYNCGYVMDFWILMKMVNCVFWIFVVSLD